MATYSCLSVLCPLNAEPQARKQHMPFEKLLVRLGRGLNHRPPRLRADALTITSPSLFAFPPLLLVAVCAMMSYLLGASARFHNVDGGSGLSKLFCIPLTCSQDVFIKICSCSLHKYCVLLHEKFSAAKNK